MVGVASSIRDALPLLDSARPDIVLADLSLGDGSAVELVRALRRGRLKGRVIVITGFSDEFAAAEALAAGANGYVLKSQPTSELLEAIRTVAEGRKYVAPALERRLAMRQSPANRGVGRGGRARAAVAARGRSVPSGRRRIVQQGRRATAVHQREDRRDPSDEHEPEAGGPDDGGSRSASRRRTASRWRRGPTSPPCAESRRRATRPPRRPRLNRSRARRVARNIVVHRRCARLARVKIRRLLVAACAAFALSLACVTGELRGGVAVDDESGRRGSRPRIRSRRCRLSVSLLPPPPPGARVYVDLQFPPSRMTTADVFRPPQA